MAEDKQVSIRVYLTEELRNLLKSKAAREGRTMNEAVVEQIENYVADIAKEVVGTKGKDGK